MPSTTSSISEFIEATLEGEVVCAKLLLHLGSRAAIDEALYRMAKSGEILRVGRGLYARAIENKYGRRAPSPESVVESVAKLKGEEVQLAPAALANMFGLTTQVPMRVVYQTSGAARTLRLGKLAVEMRRAPKWLFAIKSKAAREVASVLHWLLENGDAKRASGFLTRLSPEERAAIESARSVLPEWMAAIVSKEMRVTQ